MCLFVRNQDFQRHTEHLINSLHTSTSQAAQTLDSVSATLDQQQARTDAMAGRMETLSADQAQLGSGIQQGLSQLAALQNASQQLDSGLAATLQRTVRLMPARTPEPTFTSDSRVLDADQRAGEPGRACSAGGRAGSGSRCALQAGS